MSGDCGHGWGYHFDGPSGPCYKCVMEDNERLRAELASMTEALFQLQEAVRADTARNDLKKVTVAFMEFYKDWKKGDFHLSELAALDAEAVFNAIVSIDVARNPFAKEKKE